MKIVKQFAATPEGLAEVPELTTEAVEAARWDVSAGCLIDRVYPGRPLFICFSYRELQMLRSFDFYGRTKKLEDRFGVKFNRILVRDVLNQWYHRGVTGLGSDVDEVTGSLRTLIDAISPDRVFTIGQSMGAYAAIMHGMLLGADRIAAFGTLSHLDPDAAIRDGDRGFLGIMNELRANPPRRFYGDLVRLGKDSNFGGELHVIFGTHPREDDRVSGNFDAVHALRLAQLPGTILHPYPGSDHGVVPWLVDNGRIDGLLAELFVSPDDPAGELHARPADLPAREG